MDDARDTRGARKLAAAIEAFRLGERIAGARALDVGASTGGFTATLLACGAAEVTAIEVGHDQLAPELRADPRVHLHERTDFRRAPLSLAEGPFGFFTVDVGFMAARNTLRSLAFRLAPGAEGVVLLKPQFELPTGEVRGGDVSDPALRARALARFQERAERLGFAVVAHADSPVAGGSGTVEVLLHLRFRERPAHLPRPGERKPPPARDAASPSAPARAQAGALRWFAIAAPGFEPVVADELRALAHVTAVNATQGGVEFQGPLAAGYAANLHSRVATRVVVRLGEARAREFAVLRRRLQQLPFESWLAPERPLRVEVSARRCRLYHTKALAETLLLAAGDRLRAPLSAWQSSERDGDDDDAEAAHDDARAQPSAAFGHEPFARVLLRGEDDRFVVSVDTSGLLLHRRGARAEIGRAPLRETLAAGVLQLAGYRGDEPLIDAMCGSGTLAIEAADIACRRSPGRMRAFAFETLPNFDAGALAALREHAGAAAGAQPACPIVAFDRDARAVERARRNAARAGASDQVVFAQATLETFTPDGARGLIVLNPPYGRRLSTGDTRAFFKALGHTLRARFSGWRVAVLVPAAIHDKVLGLHATHTFALVNGGLRVRLLVAQL
jgi:putative N6-adenine-specific DNA methylase